MSKGITYTVTEADGFTHTRYSAGHIKPHYTHAVVRVPHGRKSQVNYASREDLARSNLADALKPLMSNAYTRKNYPEEVGKPANPDAKIYPVTWRKGR